MWEDDAGITDGGRGGAGNDDFVHRSGNVDTCIYHYIQI